ncbi:signal transduction histidine kinase [Anaerolinea thermolimosa]|nr:signal transduction histidine kinase [Anaerolinea thermolimosa]
MGMQPDDSLSRFSDDDLETRLLNALANLNRIGSTINRIGSGNAVDERTALRMIVEGATQVVPGASAVIYAYDSRMRVFVPESRVSAGELAKGVPGEQPRPDGMGWRAIQQRQRVLSYEEPHFDIDPVKARAGARVVACFPLVVAEEPLGVLYVYLAEERPFTGMELLMLENFVNQAGMAIFQIQRMAEVSRYLMRKEEELERLRRAGLIISSRLGLKETLEAILEMALEVTSAQYGIFRLLEGGGSRLVTKAVAGAGLGHPYTQTLAIDSPSISMWVVQNRQPVLISDLTEEPWSSIYFPLDANVRMQSELAVPLISASGRVLGVLNLESPYKNAFSDDDRILLQSFATQAVIAIQEVRLLDAVQEIPQLLLTRTRDEVLDRLASLACDLLNAASSGIWLVGENGADLVAGARNEAENTFLHAKECSELRAFLTDEVVLIPRWRLPESLARGLFEEGSWNFVWLAPLSSSPDDKSWGWFAVFVLLEDASQGGEWEKKVMGMLAHFSGMAILYASHLEELRKTQEQRAVAEMFAAVGDLATNLLHQLNNKVGTIPVRVQGIQDKCADLLAEDRYLASNLAEIERSAMEAMLAVREHLIHLHPMQISLVNLKACVDMALESVNLGSGIQVEEKGLAELPQIPAAQQSLKLVFSNLLENAARAMGGKGKILIHGQLRDDSVRVLVTDSGPGIPPEMHDRIFDLSYSSGQEAHAGKLGFGLWWVRALMMRLGGSIRVESDGKTGTTFILQFPKAGQ